jgi:hypothetical protein
MPDSQPLLAFWSDAIESRFCSRCKAPMMLAGVKPASLGFDLRTFDCVRCRHVERATVETKRQLPFYDMLEPRPRSRQPE